MHLPQDMFPELEPGEEGLRSRLQSLGDRIRVVSDRLGKHRRPAAPLDGVPTPDRVAAEAALLRSIERHGAELRRLGDDVTDCLDELTRLDDLPAHKRGEAADLAERMRLAAVRSPDREEVHLLRQTLEYAASPLLSAEGGRLFAPTRLFLARYAEHTQILRGLWSEVRSLCDMLLETVEDALSGPAQKSLTKCLGDIDALSPDAFEKFVGELLERDGYRLLRSKGGAGDQGVDVLAVDEFNRHIIVQCKHFRDGKRLVGQPVPQHLYGGSAASWPSSLAIVVTNGRFSAKAVTWAGPVDRMHLIGRTELERWSEYGEPLAEILKSGT